MGSAFTHYSSTPISPSSFQNLLGARDKLGIEIENLFHAALEFGAIERRSHSRRSVSTEDAIIRAHNIHVGRAIPRILSGTGVC